MTQTRLGSLIESLVNIFIGFWINFIANLVILPAFGFTSLTWRTNLVIGAAYTVVSVVRSYSIRRWFNARLHRAAQRLAEALGNSMACNVMQLIGERIAMVDALDLP